MRGNLSWAVLQPIRAPGVLPLVKPNLQDAEHSAEYETCIMANENTPRPY
jgi:hypothetical protein